MEATFGHGLPFVFFRVTGGDAIVTPEGAFSTWYSQDGMLGLTIQGRHYGVFAPTGSTWSGTGPLQSSLNGQDYLSIALLPDNQTSTLELFRTHAYAFVTDSTVDWVYDEAAATVQTTYSYETELMESNGTSVNETMTALYRHQWLNTSDPLTGYSYPSVNGEMKLYAGSTFTTDLPFSGVLPALPDRGDYNPAELLAHVQDVAAETLPTGATYDERQGHGALRPPRPYRGPDRRDRRAGPLSRRDQEPAGGLVHRGRGAGVLLHRRLGRHDRVPVRLRGGQPDQRSSFPRGLRHHERGHRRAVRQHLGGAGQLGRHGQPADQGRQQLGPGGHAVSLPAVARRLCRALLGGGTRGFRGRQQPGVELGVHELRHGRHSLGRSDRAD